MLPSKTSCGMTAADRQCLLHSRTGKISSLTSSLDRLATDMKGPLEPTEAWKQDPLQRNAD